MASVPLSYYSMSERLQSRGPDLHHPNHFAKWDTVCLSAALTISTLLFALRTHVRLAIKHQWILEDWMCCASWIGLIAFCASMTTTTEKYSAVHKWESTSPEVHKALYWVNLTSVLYGVSILCTKLSILLLYRRVFLPYRGSPFDWVLRVFMTLLCIFYLTTTVLKICECRPRARIWDKSLKGSCISVSTLLNASGLFNTTTDFLILLVPVKAVWKLQMGRKRKLAVVLIFTVGLT